MAGNHEAATPSWEVGKCSQGEMRQHLDQRQDSVNSPIKDVGAVIDLSGQGLQKLGPSLPCPADTHTLILDKNQIIKLEHLEKFKNLMQLSVANNRLVRMMGVAKLTCLRVLNLPHNSIGYVEGLKDLVHIEWLNLAGNNLKTIDQINGCTSLRHLDLSDNNLSQTGDLSKLVHLKTLLLHGNNITSLRAASVSLPHSLTIISLAENEIRDLNEISFLAFLLELEQLSIMNNPCVMPTPSIPEFDYRPYVVSWCLSLKVLDGYVVSQKESLKAEWLYSQGKGRFYRPGQHTHLIQYLASVCPLTSTAGLQTTEDAKLEKILNKQRYHQRQLMYQCSKKTNILSNSDRDLTFSSQYQSMSHGQHSTTENESIYLESWIGTNSSGDHPHTIRNFIPNAGHTVRSHPNDLHLEDIQTDEDKLSCSLLSSESTFMPVASGLSPVSPSGGGCIAGFNCEQHANIVLDFVKNLEGGQEKQDQASRDTTEKKPEEKRPCELLPCVSPVSSCKNGIPSFSNCPGCSLVSAEDLQGNMARNVDKTLPNIIWCKESNCELSDCRDKEYCKLSVSGEEDTCCLSQRNKAATKLQACWRGFRTRNYHPRAQKVRYEIRLSRMQEHILFLRAEVSKLQKEKEEERVRRMVQEAAVKLLWSNVQSLQQWQLSVSQRLVNSCQPSVQTTCSSCPSHWSAHSSSPSSGAPCDHACCSEIKHEHSSSDMPDSGFHSIIVDHADIKDPIFFNTSTVAGSRVSGQSEDNVNHHDTADPGSMSDMQQKDSGECRSDSPDSEHDSSLLQQYLKTVGQLAEGDDTTSCSDQTEDSRVHANDLQEN